ncbi:Uncharacterised protein [Mycobacteroides abscessus subsp. abscessus]|nr:Uncharacterised protein [Mycobacteroides abscessus subsp. abscessus]SKV44938.1 Uncharacterised protein [Mycobacteroides abscessus subsp. abscessus]
MSVFGMLSGGTGMSRSGLGPTASTRARTSASTSSSATAAWALNTMARPSVSLPGNLTAIAAT